jgi:hypothetical protein
VDGADYVAWRNGLGTIYTPADYNTWRSQFGQIAIGAGSGAGFDVGGLPSGQVPEQVAALLWLIGGIMGFTSRRIVCRTRNCGRAM